MEYYMVMNIHEKNQIITSFVLSKKYKQRFCKNQENHKLWKNLWTQESEFFCEDLYNSWLHFYIKDMEINSYSHMEKMEKKPI